jgi:hypothetical protein
MAKHKLTKKEEMKGGKDSHMHEKMHEHKKKEKMEKPKHKSK